MKNPERKNERERDESVRAQREGRDRESRLTSMTVDLLGIVLLQAEDDLARHHLLPFPFPEVVVVCQKPNSKTESVPARSKEEKKGKVGRRYDSHSGSNAKLVVYSNR